MSEIHERVHAALTDWHVTPRAAAELMTATLGSEAALAEAAQATDGLDATTAASWAHQVAVAAHEQAEFVPVSGSFYEPQTQGQLVTTRFDPHRTIVAGVMGQEFGNVGDAVRMEQQQQLSSWADFPAFLQTLRARQQADPEHRSVALVLAAHGNAGTGFKLSTLGADGVEHASIASAAWINSQLAAAGFRPEDIDIVSEACHSGASYQSSINGFRDTAQVEAMAQEHRRAGAKSVSVELVDISRGETPNRDFRYIGRAEGSNLVGVNSVMLFSGVGLTGTVTPGTATAGASTHSGGTAGFRIRPEQRLVYLNSLPEGSVQATPGRGIEGDGKAWGRLISLGHQAAPDLVRSPEEVRALARARRTEVPSGGAGGIDG